jgi:hypothetical protein
MYLDRFSSDELSDILGLYEETGRLGFRLLRALKALLAGRPGQSAPLLRKELMEYSRENPFVFRGTKQDLSYFWGRTELPLARLDELDQPLRDVVAKNFSEWQRQGLVTVNGKSVTLTDAGKTFIHDTGFISETLKADLDLNQKIQKGLNEELGSAARFHPGAATAPAPGQGAAAAGSAQAAGAAAQGTAQAAGTAGTAATVGSAAAGPAAPAVAVAAKVGQEVLSAANQFINSNLTHK